MQKRKNKESEPICFGVLFVEKSLETELRGAGTGEGRAEMRLRVRFSGQ